jgi:nucleoside-diphosphate-sugar epimerase
MRVLLAGASGAIGRYLVPQLTAAGHDVIGITRTPGSLSSSGAREVVADVLDRPALLAALDGITADAVIHQLTALSKAPSSLRDMRPTNRLRTEGTSALIAAARQVGAKKFVAASFFGGYGLSDHGRAELAESAPFGEPDGRADPVQTALLSLEQQVRAFGGVSLRFGLFYDSTSTAVSPVSRTWDGVLPMLHLSDAAAATVRVLAKYQAGSVYNIADDHPLSYRARESARAKAAGRRHPQRLPDSVLRMAAPFGSLLLTSTSVSLDRTKARAELGWTPQFPSLHEGLGVAAPVVSEAVLLVSVPKPVAEVEPTPEIEAEPTPEPTAEPEPTPEPEPVLETEPEPAATTAPKAAPRPARKRTQKPAPPASVEPAPQPRTRAVRHPKAPVPLVRSADAFQDVDDAIARIGVWHDD